MFTIRRKLGRRVYINGDAWYILNRIGSGRFGKVFKAENDNRVKAVAKICEQDDETLQREANVYRKLQNANEKGFPRIFGLTEDRGKPVLLLERLGPKVGVDFKRDQPSYSLSEACTISKGLLDRLRTLHSIGVIHCDLRLENMLYGKGDEVSTIHLIDFGICQQYINDDGTHVEDKLDRHNQGNVRYGCKRMFYGLQQSRRDDMESFLYLLAYLMKRNLPWYSEMSPFTVYNQKQAYRRSPFYQSLPSEYHEMWETVSQLEFCEEPIYEWFHEKISEMNHTET